MENFASGIVIGIDPTIGQIGSFALRWYGVIVAAALVAGLYLALREGRLRGVEEDPLYTCALWAILGGIVGARLFHIVDKLDFYLANPGYLISVMQGGLAMWGGLLGGMLAAAIYCRVRRHPFGRIADAAAPGLIVGQAIGRIGSLINGDAWGSATTLPWGLIYTNPNSLIPPTSLGVPTHPYPVYEILWGLLILGVLWRLRPLIRVDGALFLVYLALYSVGRFGLTFVREEGIMILGLQQAQVVAAIVLLVALPWLTYLLQGSQPDSEEVVDPDQAGG